MNEIFLVSIIYVLFYVCLGGFYYWIGLDDVMQSYQLSILIFTLEIMMLCYVMVHYVSMYVCMYVYMYVHFES